LTMEDVLERIASSHTILVASGDRKSLDYEATGRVALSLALRLGAKLVLVDRSKVTLGDTPNSQQVSEARAEAEGRNHLLEQAHAAGQAGVREVELWTTSMPTVEGVMEVAMATRPDVVVLPATMHDPSLVERLTLRHLPEKVVQSAQGVGAAMHIVAVEADGGLRLTDS
jgi:hypothetical protein